jgi:hypothetical protein
LLQVDFQVGFQKLQVSSTRPSPAKAKVIETTPIFRDVKNSEKDAGVSASSSSAEKTTPAPMLSDSRENTLLITALDRKRNPGISSWTRGPPASEIVQNVSSQMGASERPSPLTSIATEGTSDFKVNGESTVRNKGEVDKEQISSRLKNAPGTTCYSEASRSIDNSTYINVMTRKNKAMNDFNELRFKMN